MNRNPAYKSHLFQRAVQDAEKGIKNPLYPEVNELYKPQAQTSHLDRVKQEHYNRGMPVK